MSGPSSAPRPPESYLRILTSLVGVLACLAVLTVWRPGSTTPPPSSLRLVPAPKPVPSAEHPPAPPPSAPGPDREAIARAEAAVEAARTERQLAEAAAEAEARNLSAASFRAATQSLSYRSLPSHLHDPSARIARARSRGGMLLARRDRLKDEVIALARTPRPHRKSLIDQSPVARMVDGDESHFEVRHDRVTVVHLDRLMEQLKVDARLRLRHADPNRPLTGTVGPVGAFSMKYEIGRTLPDSIVDTLGLLTTSYGLKRIELVPETDSRGETWPVALQPTSDFARTIHRLNPTRDTITMWVYPDGFSLYRRLRDLLHQQGFLVAGRPLPDGQPIVGSPSGEFSAGQ